MKVTMVAPLGTSPPVVTEALDYFHRTSDPGEMISDVTLLITEERDVAAGAELLRVAVPLKFHGVHVHLRKLPYEDIASNEELEGFISYAIDVLSDQYLKHGADKVYLNVAGGRKDMCVSLALLGQLFSVSGVLHVVMKDVRAFNVELERRRQLIRDLAELPSEEERRAFYLRNREDFDLLLYPHPSEYEVIKIPILPYPRSVLKDVVGLLGSGRVKVDIGDRLAQGLPLHVVDGLASVGLVKLTRTSLYVTEEGRRLGRLLRKILNVT